MKLGNLNLSDIKLGTQQVKKVIFGNNLVWQSISYIIQEFKTRVFAVQGEFEAETCMNTQLTDLDNKGLLDSASFVLTPNGYEENLLFAVKPDKVGTNLLLQSEGFTQAAWVLLGSPNVTRTANAGTSPIGTNNATLLTNNSTSTFGIRQSITISPNTQYVFSCWVRSDNPTEIRVDISDLNVTSFNLTNTWQRIQVLGTYNNSYAANLQFVDIVFGPNQLGSSFFIWGAQLELGSTATDYISTTDRAIINGTIGDLTVTRATLGTRVNADGDIEQVPYNLQPQSQNLENAVWVKQQVTIGQDAIIAPDGTMTADNVIANSGVTYAYAAPGSGVNLVSSSFITFLGTITASIYLKYNGLNRIRFRYGSASTLAGNLYVEVDLQTGTITGTRLNNGGADVISNPFIEDAGNGWYRVGFNLLTSLSATNNRIGVTLGDTTKTTGNGVDGVYVWGAQLVVGTQARDYFPTTNRFNIPRIDYSNGSCPSVLVETTTSNQIRNNQMVGAAVGNPGTLPTNWSGSGSIVSSLGVENGIEYIDIRIAITATSGFARIFFEPSTQIVAANGQTWTLSSYLKIIDAPQPPTGYRLRIFETTSTGALITSGFQTITPTTSFARYSFTRTLNGGATVERVQPILEFTTVSGQTYDFTIRISGPQMEQLSFATSLIQTSTAAITRNADVISNTNARTLIGQTEGTIYIDANLQGQSFSDNVSKALYEINLNNTSQNRITLYRFNNLLYYDNVVNNVVQSSAPFFTITNFNGKIKIALVYQQNNVKVFVNGTLVNTNTTALIPTCNNINIGHFRNSGFWNGTINSAALWKTKLTDAQAIQLTTL